METWAIWVGETQWRPEDTPVLVRSQSSHAQALRQSTKNKLSFPGLEEESCSQSEDGSEKASGRGFRDSGASLQAGSECILENRHLGGSGMEQIQETRGGGETEMT